MTKKNELTNEEIEIGRIQNKISIVQLENRISSLEKVIESLYKDVNEIREVMTMHIKCHIAEQDPIHIYNKVDSSNRFSYTWGNYYKVPFNAKTKEI